MLTTTYNRSFRIAICDYKWYFFCYDTEIDDNQSNNNLFMLIYIKYLYTDQRFIDGIHLLKLKNRYKL